RVVPRVAWYRIAQADFASAHSSSWMPLAAHRAARVGQASEWRIRRGQHRLRTERPRRDTAGPEPRTGLGTRTGHRADHSRDGLANGAMVRTRASATHHSGGRRARAAA